MKYQPHFSFSPEEKRQIKNAVMAIAEKCSFPLKPAQITFCGLAKEGYSHEALCIKGEEFSHICEFPLAEKGGQKAPKPDLHQEVFQYIRGALWRQLRSQCYRYDSSTMPHHDATWNSIWNERLVAQNPDIQTGMSASEGRFKLETEIKKDSMSIRIEDSQIVVPKILPASYLASFSARRLNEIIDMPHCGDDWAQEGFGTQIIIAIKAEEETLHLTSSIRVHPLMGEEGIYPWRQMRHMSGECFVYPISHKPEQYDQERDIRIFLGENEEFFQRHGYPQQWYQDRLAA